MRDVERLAAAHRESRDGAVSAVGDHPVVLLDVRHHVLHEIVRELVAWRCGRRRAAAPRPPPSALVWPAGMTTIIGLAFSAAIRLSRMKLARPTDVHESSQSPAPWSR